MIGILELPAHLAGCITGRASEVAQPWGTWVVVQHCSCSSTVSSVEALTLITAVAERTVLAEGIGAAPPLHRKMLTVSRGARGLPSVLGLLGCLSAPSGCTHTHHCQLLKDCREQARETARNMVPQVWARRIYLSHLRCPRGHRRSECLLRVSRVWGTQTGLDQVLALWLLNQRL